MRYKKQEANTDSYISIIENSVHRDQYNRTGHGKTFKTRGGSVPTIQETRSNWMTNLNPDRTSSVYKHEQATYQADKANDSRESLYSEAQVTSKDINLARFTFNDHQRRRSLSRMIKHNESLQELNS